jgi:putative glutamine amidotransferase
MKKKLGISFSRTNFQYYWNWFTKEDLQDDIELVELSFEKNNLADIEACDAFVLTGGVDIHPSLYKGHENYPNQPDDFQIERDLFEKKIYEHSQQNHLPVLAICRGMQLVNVLHGGKLIHDLDENNPVHKKDAEDKIHHVNVVDGSLLHSITGKTACEINSAHHQAIDSSAIGENLQVNAVAEDDTVIEGIEFKNKTGKAFLLGVQWHPERIKNKDEHPFSKNIKQRFLTEIRNTK